MQLVDLPAIDFCPCDSCVCPMKYITACMHKCPKSMCPVCIECCHLYDREIDMSLYCNPIMTDASTIQQLI